MKLNFYLLPIIKTNLKWVKCLNLKAEQLKFLDENIGNILQYIAEDTKLVNKNSIGSNHYKNSS